MTTRLVAGGATSLALGALLAGASVVLSAGAAPAVPQSLPVRVSFTDLLPGDARSTSWPVQIPATSRIATGSVLQVAVDGVHWTATLCPTSGAAACLDAMAIVPGTPIDAGDYVMSVGVAVTGDIEPGLASSLEGRYTLVEDGVLADTSGPFGQGRGRSLAGTGSSPLPVAAAALATTAVGVVLVVLARRRRDDGEPETETAGTV